MASFISPARKRFDENQPIYFQLGGGQSRNVLKDFKGPQSKEIKILFLGCHDLRNVLQTIASKASKSGLLNIHLNHSCPFSLARNVLVLKVISASNFNVNSAEDLKYLWDLWYNLEWPKSTLDRFIIDIKELIEMGLPEQNLDFTVNQFKYLKDVWRNWLSSLTKLTKSSEIEKVLRNRLEFINTGGRIGKEMVNQKEKMSKTFEPAILEQLVFKLSVGMITGDTPKSLKNKLIKEIKRYYRTGSCNPATILKSAAVNPTLLEIKSLWSLAKTPRWRVDIYSSPFMGFMPLPLDELETTEEDIATLYCQKMLKNFVASYRKFKKCIKFHFHWSDNLQFCLIGTSEMFDVIDCSTLADEVGLANLILSASPRLNHKSPDSLMITESSEYWCTVASSIANYVEEALCAPLSMIPSLYGVRLANDASLGSNAITTKGNSEGFPDITLTWRQAPQFENVSLGLSPSLELCLKNLEKKCYFIENESNTYEKDKKFFRSYSPLTYYYMVKNLVSRSENPEGLQESLLKTNQLKRVSQFSLNQKAIDAWANRCPVVLFTAIQLFTPEVEDVFQRFFKAPMLRVMLIPINYLEYEMEKNKNFVIHWIKKYPDVHYIENFNLSLHEQEADCIFPTLQLSFVLPKEHRLKPNHCAVMLEMYSGCVMLSLGMINEMKQETINKSNSSKKQLSARFKTGLQASFLEAENCQESPKDFTVNISVHTKDIPKGLNISSDGLPPCEAGHKITFSIAEPEGVQPLTLCFPHPVLVDCIDATLRRTDRNIRVVLKKALHEPWPYDFNLKPKWNVDKLNLWKELNPQDEKSELFTHVAIQKGFQRLKNYLGMDTFGNSAHLPEVRLLSPMELARNLIGTILIQVQKKGCEFFAILKAPPPGQALAHANEKPLFYIRAHPPILTSPFGSPMILLSVLDCRLSDKLVKNGQLKERNAKEDLERIFRPRNKNSSTPMTLWTNIEDSTSLLRYVFRLNSTKMKPSSWQEENLPLGKCSPYLATFVSPLYLDHFPAENLASKKGSKQFSCAGCGKKSSNQMKRCSRCKTMTYCTAECQKAHWRQHKLVCSEMEPTQLMFSLDLQ